MADLVRVSLGGDMPSGEKWSINPVFRPLAPIALSSDEASQMATAIAGTTITSLMQALNVPGVTFRTVRVEARTAAGALESVGEAAKGTPTVGTGSSPHPFQTSICLSLLTTTAGARGKGRLFYPATSLPLVTGTLRAASGSVDDFLSGMNSWLASVRTAVRSVGGWNTAVLGVWSRSDEQVRIVTQLRAGDILDTQRRRRDSTAESYKTVAVTAPAF